MSNVIEKLMKQLDVAQHKRRTQEMAYSDGLPPVTDPDAPQSDDERAIVYELTDPANHAALQDHVKRIGLGNMNEAAKFFFERLLAISEQRRQA